MTTDRTAPTVVGQRLAAARKARGLTQESAADHLGCSRPTLIAIEKGERAVKPAELVSLAAFYGRSVSDFVRPGPAVTADLVPHLRAAADRAGAGVDLTEPIADLQQWAEDYLFLEHKLGDPMRTNYPPEVSLTDGGVTPEALAEDVAAHERRRLGLGDQPIADLRTLLETEVGLRVFLSRRMPSALAGMYAYLEPLGGCVLVNLKHPGIRRRWTLAHEYGHLLIDRHKPGVDYLDRGGRKPANERFADAFAAHFLMPTTSVRRRYREIVEASKDFKVADLVRLAHTYFVSVPATALRLEDIGLLRRGTAQMLRDEKLQVGKANSALPLPPQDEYGEPFPRRYKYLAVRAYLADPPLISEQRLARLLRCDGDIYRAREIVDECRTILDTDAEGNTRTGFAEYGKSLLAASSPTAE